MIIVHVRSFLICFLFRGNPDKCDLYGNTCLHHAAANGMLNCVSFLVNFGTNLWSLDNDFHTALDLAGIADHKEIVAFLDVAYTQQNNLNPKTVKKLKEQAVLDAHRRNKKLSKLQSKLEKKAQKDDVKLAHTRSLLDNSSHVQATSKSAPASLYADTWRSTRSHGSASAALTKRNRNLNFADPTKPYSEHFTITSQSRKYFIGGVEKKLKQKTKRPQLSSDGDFLVREVNDGKRTVRSLTGLKRGNHVMYVNKSTNGSVSSVDSLESPLTSQETSSPIMTSFCGDQNGGTARFDRSLSAPDYIYNGDSGLDLTSSQDFTDSASMFERPGLGSIAFLRKPITTFQELTQESVNVEEPRVHIDNDTASPAPDEQRLPVIGPRTKPRVPPRRFSKKSIDDSLSAISIGTAGSLAMRVRDFSLLEEPLLDDDDAIDYDNDVINEQNSLEFFLASSSLSEYFPFFSQERITLDSLMLLTDADLEKLGLKLGPRRKLLQAVARRKASLEKPPPAQLDETWL